MNNHFIFNKKEFLIYFVIILVNLITVGQISNLILTIPEIIVVLFYLTQKRVDYALFYHLIFVITSISATSASGFSEDETMTIYSYSRLKLFGPFGVSYVMSFIILITSLFTKSLTKNILFYKLVRTFLVLSIIGFGIGLVGFFTDNNYDVSGVLNYGIYIVIMLVNGYSLVLNYSQELSKKYYQASIHLLSSVVFATAFAYFFLKVSTSYGGLNDIILQPDLIYYSSALILAIFTFKGDIRIVLPILVYLFISINTTGGKTITTIVFVAFYFVYALFFSSHYKSIYHKQLMLFRLFFILMIILAVVGNFIILPSDGSLASRKIHEFTSLFSGDLSSIDTSPYVRVVSFLDICGSFGYNPIRWLFGMGYGGYFNDVTELLRKLPNLDHGGFAYSDVTSGNFHSAHDTFCVVPLVNGFYGLFLIFKIVLKYLKRVKYNFLAIGAIPWLFLTFYFNTQLALTGMFLLYAAEYNYKTE